MNKTKAKFNELLFEKKTDVIQASWGHCKPELNTYTAEWRPMTTRFNVIMYTAQNLDQNLYSHEIPQIVVTVV